VVRKETASLLKVKLPYITISGSWWTKQSGITFHTQEQINLSATAAETEPICSPLGTGDAMNGVETTDA
jgi:hypothetical protein